MKFLEPKLGLEFEIVDWEEFALLPRLPAVYMLGIFPRGKILKGNLEFFAKFVGKTASLQEEFIENESWKKARTSYGCNHALILVESSETERDKITANLIVEYRPILNLESKSYVEIVCMHQPMRDLSMRLFVS